MKILIKLLTNVQYNRIIGETNIPISEVHFYSKKVIKSSLFIAINGLKNNGHDFINYAIKAGATAIICEVLPASFQKGVTYIQVKNSSQALAVVADNFFNKPSSKIKLVGVTGTNGKTSIVYYLFSLFEKLNFKVGLISTIENKINTRSYPSFQTTPDALKINMLLSEMVDDGCDFCFMEVSSHGLAQNRVSALDFDIAVFSNISRDHLDYHATFEEYLSVKKSFFDTLSKSAKSIVNADDNYSSTILMDTASEKILYSVNSPAHYQVNILESSASGLDLSINGVDFSTQLIGDFNAYNLLATFIVADQITNCNKLNIIHALSNVKGAPGRFNIIRSRDIMGIIDYAHTPDALKKVILAISKFCAVQKKLIVILGCGGNRDKGKRPLMGKIAFENSYMTILTSDNPRFEDPSEIINDMTLDISMKCGVVHKIPDRKAAIYFAVENATKGSVILIAGKGHENFQETNGIKQPFDDSKIFKNILKR